MNDTELGVLAPDDSEGGHARTARCERIRAAAIRSVEGSVMSEIKQVIVVRRDLQMRKGKMCAQAAHASMKFLIDNDEARRGDELYVKLSPEEAEWLAGSFTKIVVGVDSENALQDLMFRAELAGVEVHSIVDNGKTEFHGVPTLTCAAFGPCEASVLDKITGHLKLL